MKFVTLKLVAISFFIFGLVFSVCTEPKPKEPILTPPISVRFVVDGETKTFYYNPNFLAEFVDPGQSSAFQKSGQSLKTKSGWVLHNSKNIDKNLIQRNKNIQSKITEVYSISPDQTNALVVFPGTLIVRFLSKPSEPELDKIQLEQGIRLKKILHGTLVTFSIPAGPYFEDFVEKMKAYPNISEVYPDTAVEKALK
ncbi:MAG: hypothetical protein O9301_09040 [Leptospira sp.]|nr:hypothetical protein [Leptospira sp.]